MHKIHVKCDQVQKKDTITTQQNVTSFHHEKVEKFHTWH